MAQNIANKWRSLMEEKEPSSSTGPKKVVEIEGEHDSSPSCSFLPFRDETRLFCGSFISKRGSGIQSFIFISPNLNLIIFNNMLDPNLT